MAMRQGLIPYPSAFEQCPLRVVKPKNRQYERWWEGAVHSWDEYKVIMNVYVCIYKYWQKIERIKDDKEESN